jgi:hypothetical protein
MLAKYSRPVAQLILIILCGALAIWQFRAGHRLGPIAVFVVYLGGSFVLRRLLPSFSLEPQQLDRVRRWASSSHRLSGILGAVSAAIMTIFLFVTRFRVGAAPRWCVALALVMAWVWVWYRLRMSKVLRKDL